MTTPTPSAVPLAPLFVSHGAPNMILHDSATRSFLAGLGDAMPRPKAIVSISAHFPSLRPAVVADARPRTIYDFGGFERELYAMTYPAPGEPELAGRVAEMIAASGQETILVEDRGFDHGTWAPLKLMYPAADVPVVQLSVQPRRDPRHHFEIGRILAPLAEEGVLIFASGSLTHNLHAAFGPRGDLRSNDEPAPAWVTEFADWMVEHITAGDLDALLDYRARAPHGGRNHPTDEHLLPLYVALGAGGGRGAVIHREIQNAVLALDAYRFGPTTLR